jgi:hypothetical protein
MSDATTATDYDTDIQTIAKYVAAVVEAKAKITTAYTAALDNVQVAFQTASPQEAKPDVVGVLLKSGLKTLQKVAVDAVKESTGADLGPLVELATALNEEVDRAAAAANNRAAAEWISTLRATIVNNYTQGQTGEALRKQIEDEYKGNDEGGRGGYIGGIENELEAVGQVKPPSVETIAASMYVSWINQNFNNDCMDGTGFIYLQFDSDGNTSSAKVVAPLGDRVAGALNDVMAQAGVSHLMDLDVVKKVCRDSTCMGFEGNNTVRADTNDDDAHAFLTSSDNWNKFSSFSSS